MTRFAARPLPALLAPALAPALTLTLGAFLLAPDARAVSLLSNFALLASPSSSTAIGVFSATAPPNNVTRKGLRFTTGANAYTLTDVQASFALETGTDAATVTAFVYPGIGGGTALGFPDGSGGSTSTIPSPVATLQAATVAALPGSPQTYTFAANGTPVLQPNTTYLVIFTAGTVRANWHNPTTIAQSPTAQNGSGYVDPRYGLYINGSDTNVGSIANSNTSGRIQINGDIFVAVIPETGTVGLMVSGATIALVGFLRRRK